MSVIMLAFCVVAMMHHATADATGHQADVRLLDRHEAVIARLGHAAIEHQDGLCPARSIALYRRPTGLLKLVFDEDERLVAISFVALRKTAALGWPGVAVHVPAPRPYARDAALTPWFYNLSAKELSYYETAGRQTGAPTVRMYLGSVTLDEGSDFAIAGAFPFDEADIATRAEARGHPVSPSPPFAALRAWRRRAVPNSFVQVVGTAAPRSPYCDGFLLGRIGAAERAAVE